MRSGEREKIIITNSCVYRCRLTQLHDVYLLPPPSPKKPPSIVGEAKESIEEKRSDKERTRAAVRFGFVVLFFIIARSVRRLSIFTRCRGTLLWWYVVLWSSWRILVVSDRVVLVLFLFFRAVGVFICCCLERPYRCVCMWNLAVVAKRWLRFYLICQDVLWRVCQLRTEKRIRENNNKGSVGGGESARWSDI
jgi:hypothetical protein